jgi:hypothetical protein
MATLILGELPGTTPELYDQINERMGIDDENLPDGLISHVAGPIDGGMLSVDVWESREAFETFIRDQLMPAVQELGAPTGGEPRIVPVHNMFMAKR